MSNPEITNIQSGYTHDELVALIPQMRAFAGSLCNNRGQADDLAQEALTSAWRGRARYTAGTNLKAWLFRIVRNQFYSDKRRSWRSVYLDPKVAEETLIAVSNPAGALELEDVRRAMQALPTLQREALTLITVAGLSYAEAAMISGCAEGTVKSRVSRARTELLAILARGRLTAERRSPSRAMNALVAEGQRLQRTAA